MATPTLTLPVPATLDWILTTYEAAERARGTKGPLDTLIFHVAHDRMGVQSAARALDHWIAGVNVPLPPLDPEAGGIPITATLWEQTRNKIVLSTSLAKKREEIREEGKKRRFELENPQRELLMRGLIEVPALRWLVLMVADNQMDYTYGGKVLDDYVRGRGIGYTDLDFKPRAKVYPKDLDKARLLLLQASELAKGTPDPKWEGWVKETFTPSAETLAVSNRVKAVGVSLVATLDAFAKKIKKDIDRGRVVPSDAMDALSKVDTHVREMKLMASKDKKAPIAGTTGTTKTAGVKVGSKTAMAAKPTKPQRPRFSPLGVEPSGLSEELKSMADEAEEVAEELMAEEKLAARKRPTKRNASGDVVAAKNVAKTAGMFGSLGDDMEESDDIDEVVGEDDMDMEDVDPEVDDSDAEDVADEEYEEEAEPVDHRATARGVAKKKAWLSALESKVTVAAVKDLQSSLPLGRIKLPGSLLREISKAVGQMTKQLPGLAPSRELTFEEFRRFYRWSISEAIHPILFCSFVTTLNEQGLLGKEAIHKVGNISDLSNSEASLWLRSFGTEKMELDKFVDQLQGMLPPGMKVVRLTTPEETAKHFSDVHTSDLGDVLAEFVHTSKMSKEFASATLDAHHALAAGKDKVRKEIWEGTKHAKAALSPGIASASLSKTASGAGSAAKWAEMMTGQLSGAGHTGHTGGTSSHNTVKGASAEQQRLLNSLAARAVKNGNKAKDHTDAAKVFDNANRGTKQESVTRENIGFLEEAGTEFVRAYDAILGASDTRVGLIFLSPSEAYEAVQREEQDMLDGVMADSLGVAAKQPVNDWVTRNLGYLVTQVITGMERSPQTAATKLDHMVRNKTLPSGAVRGNFTSDYLQLQTLDNVTDAKMKFVSTYHEILSNSRSSTTSKFPDASAVWQNLFPLDGLLKQAAPPATGGYTITVPQTGTTLTSDKAPTAPSHADYDAIQEALVLAGKDKDYVTAYLAKRVVSGDMEAPFAAKVLGVHEGLEARLVAATARIKEESAIQQAAKEGNGGNTLADTKNKEGMKMSKSQIAKQTVMSDMKEIALRTGVKRTRKLLAEKVAEFWAKRSVTRVAGESDAEYMLRAERSREGIAQFLLSEAGQGALAYMVGFAWPMLEDQIPDETVREYGTLVAREIRIQGGTDLLDGFIEEVVLPLGAVLKDEAVRFTTGAMGAGAAIQTRVDTAAINAENTNAALAAEDEIRSLKEKLRNLEAGSNSPSNPGAVATR